MTIAQIPRFPQCRRCLKHVAPTVSGRLRAHQCPHGSPCMGRVIRTSAGFRREKVTRCLSCFQKGQLELFPPGDPEVPVAQAPFGPEGPLLEIVKCERFEPSTGGSRSKG